LIILYTPFFNHKDPYRMNDFYNCLIKNIENNLIGKIVLLVDDNTLIKHPKITIAYIKYRPTYKLAFSMFNNYYINILANTDIYFDDSLKFCEDMSSDKCYALSRYENGELFNRPDSQDVWIFNGKPSDINCEFLIGVPGCDNRIAYEINKANYKITNPSKLIKTHHLHTGSRNYNGLRVDEPYLHIAPSDEL